MKSCLTLLVLTLQLVVIASFHLKEVVAADARKLQSEFPCDTVDTIAQVFERIVDVGIQDVIERIQCFESVDRPLTGQFPDVLPQMPNLQVL